MKVSVKNSYEALDEIKLAEFESDLNCTLPKSYREFLLTHNGGLPSPNCFEYYDPVEERKEERSIYAFFCIGDKSDFLSIYSHIGKHRGLIPENYLPIAFDGQQGTVCISFAEGEEGKIFLHANWIEPDEGNIFWLSNSFEEFLDSIFVC